jgi:GT2 family glycosyltransferase
VTDVAVVIGNYQGRAVLPECLLSLEQQTRLPSEVIVADASSRDGSDQLAREWGARVVRVPNRGLGWLYNRGADEARAEYVLLANNDVAFGPRCLALLAEALDADERRFAADPAQISWDGSAYIHRRTTMSRGRLLRELIPGFRIDLKAHADGVVPTLCANGGAMIARREHLLALGGFDESMFMDFEDLDVGWRAWLHGWPSVHVPAAVVRHRVGSVTTPDVLPQRLVSSHHNLMRFAIKCLPPRDAARVLVAEFLRLGVHPRLVAPALVQVAKELPQILRERRALSGRDRFLAWALGGMDPGMR